MRKVLVIGSAGAGKSTFSKRLGEIAGIPVIHLDRHYWRPGWVEPSKDQWRDKVGRLLDGESWIIDGNYSGTMEMRLAACDTAIFLDLPRLSCTWRVIKRKLAFHGRSRPDMAPGCPERIGWEFIKWTWDYRNRSRPGVERRLREAGGKVAVYRLSSDAEMKEFLQNAKQEFASRKA